MTWKLPCGHTKTLMPWDRFPVREQCMRCHLERKERERRGDWDPMETHPSRNK